MRCAFFILEIVFIYAVAYDLDSLVFTIKKNDHRPRVLRCEVQGSTNFMRERVFYYCFTPISHRGLEKKPLVFIILIVWKEFVVELAVSVFTSGIKF